MLILSIYVLLACINTVYKYNKIRGKSVCLIAAATCERYHRMIMKDHPCLHILWNNDIRSQGDVWVSRAVIGQLISLVSKTNKDWSVMCERSEVKVMGDHNL